MKRRLALVLLLAGACAQPAPERPLPDLERHEPQVAAKLRDAHAALADGGPEAQLHFGRVLLAHHEFAAAERAFLAAAEREGDRRFECLYLAGVAAAGGAGTDAAAHIDRALALRDDYAPARIRAGTLAEQDGRTAAAEEHFRRALEIERSSHALLGLARAASARGDAAHAVELLTEARQLRPEHVEVTVLLAATLARLGRDGEAQRLAAAVPARHPTGNVSDPLVLRALAESVSFRGLVNQAARAARAGAVEDALGYYDRAIAAQPESAEAHLKKGVLLATVARYEDAIAAYRRVQQLEPTHGVAHSRTGGCLEALGRTDEAERALREGVRLHPRSVETRHALAAFLATREPDVAREILQEILDESADQVPSRLLLAEILARRGERDAARAHLATILRQQPGHPAATAMRRRLGD